MKLSKAAELIHGKLIGSDHEMGHISIDTRTLKPGDTYLALIGEHLNGHAFIKQAAEKGAAAVIVSEAVDTHLPTITVSNTQEALWVLAKNHRSHFNVPTIGITGSFGKTTARAFLENVCREAGETLASVGSFNNHIGVPLTMLQLKPSTQYFVQEMGMNHFGEMAALSLLLEPTVAIITGIGAVHLEGLGDLAGVARAKAEIFEGLPKDGVGILNADDVFAQAFKTKLLSHRVFTFGIEEKADVMATDIHLDSDSRVQFKLSLPHQKKITVQLQLLGRHNIYNALAAAAAGFALGLTPEQIKQGLEKTEPVEKRLNTIVANKGFRILNDSYNANPQAVKAAVAVLKNMPGRKVVVLGDMGELGTNAVEYHRDMGEFLREENIDLFYACGPLMQAAVQAYGSNGHHFDNRETLAKALAPILTANDVILVKGSKSMKMWEVTEALLS